MRDIMEMACEVRQAAKSPLEQQELFTEMLLKELYKMKSADIAPHLSCNFDVIRQEYKIMLSFPARIDEPNPIKSDIEQIATETAVCACQHIKAYFRQCADNEDADWGEPCADCKYALKPCNFDWRTHLQPLFKETGITIRLGRVGHSDKVEGEARD